MGSFLILTLMTLFVLSHAKTQTWGLLDYCCDFPRRFCTKELEPHCGSNGKTYDNRCFFCSAYIDSGETLKLRHLGTCGKGGESAED